MKKKLIIVLSTVTIAVLSIILLIPGVLPGASDGTVRVTRMYGDTIEGPWSNTSSETTKYVLEISTSDGQTTVVINEFTFLWESPVGTLVFHGKKGATGPRGSAGPRGPTEPYILPQPINGEYDS